MATQQLPPLFLIHRELFSRTQVSDYKYYALVTTTYVRPPISLQEHPTFSLVEHPETILQGGHWYIQEGNPYPDKWHSIQVYRPSHREQATLFHTTKFIIALRAWKQADGSSIPFVSIQDATVVLPSSFYGIGRDGYPQSEKYGVRITDTYTPELTEVLPSETRRPSYLQHPGGPPSGLPPAPSVPQPPKRYSTTFPQHLVNMVLEAAIQKGDTCPISFEPLTKTSARLTPCGHLVSHLAAEHWLSSAHSCPVCRTNLANEYLMEWIG